MVTSDGRVKVLDFGLAKLREELAQDAQGSMPTQELTGEGRILGTVAYMSPEQAEGRAVDPRSDVFSLGVMLYEMATGRRPFTGDTHLSVLSAILRDTPSTVTEIRKDLPRDLSRTIQRCLAKDPEDRYQTAKDLRNDLRALKEDLSSGDLTKSLELQRAAVASAPPSSASMPSQQAASSRMPLIAGGLVALGAVIAAAVYFTGANSQTPSVAATPFSSVSLNRLTTTGTAGVAALSGDGRYAAYVVTENRQQSLWLRQVATSSNVQIVPVGAGAYDAVTFSPDGNYVMYVVYAPNQNIASLYQVAVLGGGSRKLIEDIDTAPSFSPDGGRFAFIRGLIADGAALMIADASGANPRELMRRSGKLNFQLDAVAWSPDGRSIAAVGTNRETFRSSVLLIDAETGAEQTVGAHEWRQVSYLAWGPGGTHLLVNGVESSGAETSSQVFSLSVPGGEVTRITNDLSTYNGLSLAADGSSFVTVRNETRSRIWTMPEGKVESGQEITAGAGTDDGVNGVAWTNDGRIVYASSNGGNLDIWIMEPSGGNRVQLTSTADDEQWPVATNDGKYIVFVSNRGGPRTVYRMGVDGSAQTKLVGETVAYRPTVSGDSKWVYYSNYERRNFRVSIDGGTPEPLDDLTAGGRTLPPLFHEPIPSPDGRIFAGHYQDPDAQGERIALLSVDPKVPERRFPTVSPNARWAPDGRSLLFFSRGNLFRQPVAGTAPPLQVTKFSDGQIFAFAMSADQKQLAIVRGQVSSDVVLVTKRK
jgi:Tol biopolymer transport system component